MTTAELVARLTRRAEEAEQMQATAPAAAVIRSIIAELPELDGVPSGSPDTTAPGWFWNCAPGVRIVGVQALADATGFTTAWLYRRTARIPHARIDGVLLFEVGAVRQWLLDQAVAVRPAVTVVQRQHRGAAMAIERG